MALVSGGSFSLNPNAPLFVPASLRQVEDFSPQWWELVKTSTWFRDYWLSQHQEEDFDDSADAFAVDDDNIAYMLPDSFDLGADEEEFCCREVELEKSIWFEAQGETKMTPTADKKGKRPNGLQVDAKTILKSLTVAKSPIEGRPKSPAGPAKYREKPSQCASPRCTVTPRRIHQPR
ncbi:hypothetical protein UlMin_007450 [Ulmus minor]